MFRFGVSLTRKLYRRQVCSRSRPVTAMLRDTVNGSPLCEAYVMILLLRILVSWCRGMETMTRSWLHNYRTHSISIALYYRVIEICGM